MEYIIPFWILCGIAGAAMLSRYNKAGSGFLLGLILGPIGLIIAWTMRDTAKLDEARSGDATEERVERECPHCAERILVKAKVCKHCGREVEPVEEGIWARLAVYFGGQDIDFAESPEFSRAYRLRGTDEAAVRALFTPARRQVFELFRGQHAAGAGQELMWWRDGALPPPDQFDAFLMEGGRIQRAFARD